MNDPVRILIAVCLLLIVASCGGRDATATPMPTDASEPTRTPAPTDTPEPTHTPTPTGTPERAPTSSPLPASLEFKGSNGTVVENIQLPACQNSVFVWSVEPNQAGRATVIVDLDKIGEGNALHLEEYGVNVTEMLTGETLQPLSGGEYVLATEYASGPWRIRWECRD